MLIHSKTKVLITGVASGIGKIMARMALEKGAELIIWDINQVGIDTTIDEFTHLGKITGYKVDVSSENEIINTAQLVKQNHGNIDILINNAGMVVGKYFHEHSTQEINKTMAINANALMLITLQFLPDMIQNGGGHICNIASSAGFISNPKMSVYVASKWAAIGWSDSLRIEMQYLNTNVKVTTVTPYYINTGMFDGVKSQIIPILKPEYAAKKILKGIEKDKIYVSMPLGMHFIRLTQGILPVRAFDFVAGKILGIYHTMDHFTGRK
jgi:short-subunit dehydrogenase